MVWAASYSSQDIEFLEELSTQTGRPIQALEDRPRISPHQEWFWTVFQLLARSRPIMGMGTPGRIQVSEMIALLTALKGGALDPDEVLSSVRILTRLDDAALKAVMDRTPKPHTKRGHA